MRVLFLLFPLFVWSLSYDVTFIGLENREVIQALRETSELIALQERPPASLLGLRYRAAGDIPAFLRTLKAFSYYEAEVSFTIERRGESKAEVLIWIRPGPEYTLHSYEIYSFDEGKCLKKGEPPGCHPFTPQELGLKLGQGISSRGIVNAELALLYELSRCGYPLASIQKRRVIVDMQTKQVEAAACVEEGPLTSFGPTTLFGLKTVEPRFIERRIAWKEGMCYDADLVVKTQEQLLKTELFTSVLISHPEELDSEGGLPMRLRLTEAKHKQVMIGVFYATVDGPGGSFAWSHRNVRGMGEIVSVKLDASKRYYTGSITYKKPDFLTDDQTFRSLALFSREAIRPYLAFTYRAAAYVEKSLDERKKISVGLKGENISVHKSASNGDYWLLGLPLFGFYNRSDSLLNPMQGFTIAYSITPYQSLEEGNTHFAKQRLTCTGYIPVIPKRLSLALRAQVGSIAGTKQRHVPLPKLFLGGSEDDLRGYRYKTVSPLNQDNQPLGGRSAIFTSIELRARLGEKLGIVPFLDLGTVSLKELPEPNAKWLKSVGVGVRYFAFFGPVRVDVGFPLDRRPGIDGKYQFYATAGQAF